MSRVRIRQARGRPRNRPHAVVGDKGYSFPHIRAWCRAHHVKAVIPRRSNQRRPRRGRPASFDVILYRRRNGIERSVGWLKDRRRIATRYEKLALNFRAVIDLAIVERYLSLEFSDGP